MIKVRLTFVDDKDGQEEFKDLMQKGELWKKK